jgi:GH15 family glucan-1,4-alpha-glucosidase
VPYQPIEDYGLIGDLHTVALVGVNGSIDWLCLPRFDSPSVFAAILDDEKGGRFQIAPLDDAVTRKQFYWPETNVLVTRFLAPHGAAELTDFMPVAHYGGDQRRQVVRRLTGVRGCTRFRMVCQPAFDYAREAHELELLPGGAVFTSSQLHLHLATRVPLEPQGDAAFADFDLREGESVTFILREHAAEHSCDTLSEPQSEQLFERTVDFWRRWLAQSTYTGRWRETVQRSALVLKLLTYAPTGAIVAAPTCSLPENIGGERNWDYRYTWIRDAAFTLYAFLKLGFDQEAAAYMDFLGGLCAHADAERPLQIMYGIDGTKELPEKTLAHLEGYRGSRPVRVGNGAFDQLQLDIYGELMDSAYLYNKHGAPISYEMWLSLRRFVDWVCDNWHRSDEGIWEVRGGPREFVYSKLMCWVALDRALRLAEKRSFPADRARWLAVRDEIYEEIQDKGFDEARGAFVQSYGSKSLDAANLMMPLTFFMSPNDPRVISTLRETMKSPDRGGLVSNSLVFRYNVEETEDGLAGEEGTFNICTFWLVEALTRAGRFDADRLDQARLIFERMLGFGNHLGLYAEETGPRGEALGNFPQAFTHLALISAAYNLDRVLDGR